MDILKKLRHLAVQNAFNEKQTADFIKLVASGTSIDDAIDMIEGGISENKSVEEGVATDEFYEEMHEEWISLTHLLKDLVNEMNYDEEDLLTNCGIVSCWIVITAIQDKEDNDSFFQYVIQSHREPNEKPDRYGERLLIEIYTNVFEKLDASFEQWRKDPTPAITHHFAKTILDAIIKGDSGESKETYLDLEYSIIITFFAGQFKDLAKKNISLTEKIYGKKNKPVKMNVYGEKNRPVKKDVYVKKDKPVKRNAIIDKLNREMYQEWKSLDDKIDELIEEMDIDDYPLCDIQVACWIVIRSLHDQEYIDSFFQYFLEQLACDDDTEEDKYSMRRLYTRVFKELDPAFEHWTKNPDSGHHLGSVLLDVLIEPEEPVPYAATECTKMFNFFTQQYNYLKEKIKSIDTQKEGALPTEQPTEQPTKQADGVRAALDLLDEMAREFDNPAFEEIRKHLKLRFRKKRKKAAESFNDGNPPHKRIYSMVANLSGDWLECGEHHMYRGVLNPMGIGGDLLKIFDTIQDKLVLIGACDKKFAQEQKRAVRENIKAVG